MNARNQADRRLSEELTRLYFLGWAGISPLVFIAGLIGFVSYDFAISALLTGLWAGILNLGILWSGIFLLIAVGRVLVGLAVRLAEPGRAEAQARQANVRSRVWRGLGVGLDDTPGSGLCRGVSCPYIS
jgi:hypothetical protein